jgi:predicted small lipoprotein YifL
MRRLYLAMLSIAVLAGCGDSSQPLASPPEARLAATTETTNELVPFSSLEFVPCANGGLGEDVLLEGTLHVVDRITATPNGNLSITYHENPQGISGTGQITGDVYQGTGSVNFHVSLLSAGAVAQSFTTSFLVVGPGPDNNFTVHQRAHLTFNTNGEITVERDEITVECS